MALVPDTAAKLLAAKLEVSVESGAGSGAFIPDAAYETAGVKVVKDAETLLKDAEVVLKVQAPAANEVGMLMSGSVLISFLQPATQGDIVNALAKRLAATLRAGRSIMRAMEMAARAASGSLLVSINASTPSRANTNPPRARRARWESPAITIASRNAR